MARGSLVENDPESQARKAAFLQGLRELGWTEGQKVRIDYRWGAGNADIIRKHAAELIALAPHVTLAIAGQATYALQQESRDPANTGKHLGPHGEGHKGDLPALTVDASGKSTKRVVTPHLKLTDAKGRSIMIHAGGDNYSDQPAPLGGGGARIACGIVK